MLIKYVFVFERNESLPHLKQLPDGTTEEQIDEFIDSLMDEYGKELRGIRYEIVEENL